jgi:hypothetical protein
MWTFPSEPEVARYAPLEDHARSVIAAVCPFLKITVFSHVPSVTNCTSFVSYAPELVPCDWVGAAKTLPSGCQMILEEVSDSTSTAGIIPSIFFRRETSPGNPEKT